MKKKYLISRLFIILLLIVPFLLSYYHKSLEPYPAILLPLGKSKLKSLDERHFTYKKNEYYIVPESGKLRKITLSDSFKPLKVNKIIRLVKNNFGLEKTLPDYKIEEGKKWIREELSKNYAISESEIKAIRVNNCIITRNLNDKGKIERRSCITIKTIPLI